MCYGVIIPIVVCGYKHFVKCKYAWRQCSSASAKMDVNELCPNKNEEDPVFLDLEVVPVHFRKQGPGCRVCRYLNTDQTILDGKAFVQNARSEMNDFFRAVKEESEDYQAHAANDAEKEVKLRRWEKSKATYEHSQRLIQTVKNNIEAQEAEKVRIIRDKIKRSFCRHVVENKIDKIYFGPLTRSEVGRNPPEALPRPEVLANFPYLLYTIHSGGWLHPDGRIRLPQRPPVCRSGEVTANEVDVDSLSDFSDEAVCTSINADGNHGGL